MYADDVQIYAPINAKHHDEFSRITSACLDEVVDWYESNGLALNACKSSAILFGTMQKLTSLKNAGFHSISLKNSTISIEESIRILGVTLDSTLSLHAHVREVSRACFYYLSALRHIRSSLDDDLAKLIGSCIVGSRLDYANALYSATSAINISMLESVQNALARTITYNQPRMRSSFLLLHHLHWLPVRERIIYKNALIAHKTLYSSQPAYLANTVRWQSAVRSRRTHLQNLLVLPTSKLAMHEKSFSLAAPRAWNSLTASLRTQSALEQFKRDLKTYTLICNSLCSSVTTLPFCTFGLPQQIRRIKN